jgi:hypothetical protein
MKNIKLLLLICILSILKSKIVEASIEDINNVAETAALNQKGWIIFKESFKRCPMYTDICKFHLLLDHNIDVNTIEIESGDNSIAIFDKVELCNSTDCPSRAEFTHKTNVTNKFSNYTVYTVYLKPIIIGKTFINFSKNSDAVSNSVNFKIIVTQANRKVDFIFNIWVWSFQTLISLMMGILLDKHTLLQIIKMPIPVFIGFCCQFIFMPLVSI